MKEQFTLSKLLGELEMIYRNTAGATFSLTYLKEKQQWALTLTIKHKQFLNIVPELAVKEAIDWIKANRREVVPGQQYSLLTLKK